MSFAIETTNLTKKFPLPGSIRDFLSGSSSSTSREVVALDSVNISVPRGKLFGLIGPNGAGKTTLIKILCTLILPTSGEALIDGHDVTKYDARVRSSIGLVSGEERSFYWRLTGRQNLEFFAVLYNLPPVVARKKIERLLEELDLKEKADHRFYTYSAGIKQRMAIVRGLLNDPSILLLDELTKSLDPVSARHIREIIREKIVNERGATVVFATHRLEEVENLCDGIVVLDKGRVRFGGTLEELKARMETPEIYRLRVSNLTLGEVASTRLPLKAPPICLETPRPGELFLEFKLLKPEEELSLVVEHILKSGGTILSCEKQNTTLEEMFLELITEEAEG